MGRIRITLAVAVLGLAAAAGCGQSREKTPATDEIIQEGGNTMTKEQEDLLVKISVNEEKVRAGNLQKWQIQVLEQYDFCMEYLAGKYPSHTFSIVDCSPKTRMNSYASFWFTADGGDTPYELYLQVGDEGEADRAEDNFYGALVKKEYEGELLALLQKEGVRCIGVDASISSVRGESCGENLRAQDILTGAVDLAPDHTIFLDGAGADARSACQQLQTVIRDRKICGSYRVIVLTEVPQQYETGADLWEYVKENGERVYSLRESFSLWE